MCYLYSIQNIWLEHNYHKNWLNTAQKVWKEMGAVGELSAGLDKAADQIAKIIALTRNQTTEAQQRFFEKATELSDSTTSLLENITSQVIQVPSAALPEGSEDANIRILKSYITAIDRLDAEFDEYSDELRRS